MNVKERVSDLIKSKSPGAMCDDCIARTLKLTVRQHANHKTLELSKEIGFHRSLGICLFCKSNKKVIGYTSHTQE